MKILTDEELKAIRFQFNDVEEIQRSTMEAVLEKLKAQEPDAWRTFDGEGGYDYRSYVDNEKYQAEFLARNPSSTYKNWVEPLYLHPLPPNDVVLDAERYRWLVDNSYDRDGFLQFQVWKHSWEPHSKTGVPIEWKCRVRGPAIDAAIDAAMKEMK